VPVRARHLATLAAGCALALGGCGDTLQDQPIAHNLLEGLVAAPFPVYWLGGSFRGLAITEVARDPSGAFSVRYGDCVVGGQGTCVSPVRVVTSPDNSFVPGAGTIHDTKPVRGVVSLVAQRGTTIEIPTGGVVVDIYAETPRLARAAARTAVPINAPGAPEARLPGPLPDTGFGERPLASQTPLPPRALR